MRILALNQRCILHPEAGGAEKSLFEQARHWVAEGHEVTIVTADPGRHHAPTRDDVIDGIKVYRRGGRLSLFLFAALFLLRHGRRFDRILDVCNGIPFFTPLLTRTPHVLLVHHVHSCMWFTEFRRPFSSIGWFVERHVVPLVYRRQHVIAVSPSTRDALVGIGFAPSQVRIVYGGVERPRGADSVPLPGGRRIAYVGRLKRYKRVDLLVRMVAELRTEFPDLHLDIVGQGDAESEIEALITHLRLQDRVTLHGYVSEVTKARILRSATVFGMPSEIEGWGLSVIEANTYGCPAVAFDVPGLRVAVRHGKTGLLAADKASFRAALALILRDGAKRERLSRAAQQWAATFDWQRTAREAFEVLSTCNTAPLESLSA